MFVCMYAWYASLAAVAVNTFSHQQVCAYEGRYVCVYVYINCLFSLCTASRKLFFISMTPWLLKQGKNQHIFECAHVCMCIHMIHVCMFTHTHTRTLTHTQHIRIAVADRMILNLDSASCLLINKRNMDIKGLNN
jgi:hypothetical protein